MEASKRKALEAAGWKSGDAADFLGMNDQERKRLDARVKKIQAKRIAKAEAKRNLKGKVNRAKSSQATDQRAKAAENDSTRRPLDPLPNQRGSRRA